MRIMKLSVVGLSPFFVSTGFAANLIWGAFPSHPDCDSCLDQTFDSCPGDYMTEPYAQCMCAGDGATNMVTCTSICGVPDQNLGLTWDESVASGWYTYCIMFYKQLCPAAKEHVTPELYEDPARCGGVTVAEDGTVTQVNPDTGSAAGGDSGSGGSPSGESVSGGDAGSGGGNGNPEESGSGSGPTEPAITTGLDAASTGAPQATGTAGGASRPSSSTAAANAGNPLPTLGVLLGLGLHLAAMDL
ncbi:hypothetical protein B0H66DRAFT_628918 [Apodospora peruviana]|uniref:Uncharacterized protein n=1 Tax=Apodospora peruviana TaxID=516989 RepID=A0AAE0HUU3_9PEZI|nr:hypothetical protein B0H66DRAFT_628918 [Apodospora peruviana]